MAAPDPREDRRAERFDELELLGDTEAARPMRDAETRAEFRTGFGCVVAVAVAVAAGAIIALVMWHGVRAGTVLGTAIESGRANFANPSHGPNYLAIRADRGTVVRICGAGACQVMRSTDYGPKVSTGDIADIALARFAEICGVSVARARIIGECDVTLEVLDIELPATDTAP